ncbi:hypothetical protein WJX84_004094 [Apatococcus fuscideae]|uniref:Uncharacterized protein n=1 Tax=Apatococcus fuscideae TaxID=2026836 RepID=A0AAW1T2J0_9CHLO
MFANIPVTCNWQLQQAEGQTESDQESSAVTYAPAPGARQPCEINVQLWQLEEQGGATSIRIKSSARTYELYAKAHSTASPSYVASFRGKETEEAGIFFVKIPLQESCSRASEAILRLLSIRDKTRLEVHQVALDVPGIRGGVLEAPDDAEHSIPEPITWNEGLSALSPKAQSQAAQIRGMLQSALQPGPPTNGNGVRPGFARGNPPAQLMQAIAKAALESQVMPSLPPVAARSMPSGTLSRHQRRLSDPGGITRQNVYPGPESSRDSNQQSAAVHSLGAKVSGLGKSAEQGSAVASTMAGLRKEFEGRLRELEDACKDNGTLLRQALSRPAAAPAPRSLQELSDQARGKTQETRSPVGSPQDSHHSRSSSMDSQGSMGESEHSWQTATADLASQASMHSVSSHGSARGTPRVQPPPPKPIRGRWSLPNV